MLDLSAWKTRAAVLFGTLALIWSVSLYGLYVDERLVFALALVPRRVDGLPGILSAPLVHGSFAHLLANTFPLLILGGMVVIRGGAYYLTTTLPIVVLGGLGCGCSDATRHTSAPADCSSATSASWSPADTTNADWAPLPSPSWWWSPTAA